MTTSTITETRRTYGAGTVTKTRNGRYRAQVRLPDGSRPGETFDTEEEAEAFRAALVIERNDAAARGELARKEEPPAPLTLARWGADTWLPRREARVRWPAQDRSRWKLHVAPSKLAAMPLADIRAKHVRAWVEDLVATKRNGKYPNGRTCRHAYNILRAALDGAVEAEIIAANPAVGVKIPKRPGAAASGRREYLTAEEIAAVLGCEAIPEAARLTYSVAVHVGARQGEMVALRWGDVHETGERPHVVIRASHRFAGSKNGKVQSVPLLPQACAAFARLRELAGDPDANDLVFPSPRGHMRQPGDDFGWSSRKVRGKPRVGHRELAGVNRKVVFHGLRSTAGSHMLLGTFGVTLTLAEVAVILRHEDVATTDGYAYATADHVFGRLAALHQKRSPEGSERHVDGTRDANSSVKTAVSDGSPKPKVTGSTPVPRAAVYKGFREGGDLDRVPSFDGARANAPERSSEALRVAALDFLRAVDEGQPARPLARELAVEVLRRAAPDSAPWLRAVDALEAGALRVRVAVDLAGLVLDAERVADEAQRAAG